MGGEKEGEYGVTSPGTGDRAVMTARSRRLGTRSVTSLVLWPPPAHAPIWSSPPFLLAPLLLEAAQSRQTGPYSVVVIVQADLVKWAFAAVVQAGLIKQALVAVVQAGLGKRTLVVGFAVVHATSLVKWAHVVVVVVVVFQAVLIQHVLLVVVFIIQTSLVK